MHNAIIQRIVEDRTPIHMPESRLRKQYVRRFRHQAAEWLATVTDLCEIELRDTIRQTRQAQATGQIIIAAYRAGVLPDVGAEQGVGGLHQLVREHTKALENDPLGTQGLFAQCSTSLFHAVAGGRMMLVHEAGDVNALIGVPSYGLAPRLDPNLLDLPRNQHYAAVCEMLAEWVELGDPSAAASQPSAPDTKPRSWEPPEGFVGTKTIIRDLRFHKNGKNPPRTTIDGWIAAAKQRGEAPERHYAQGSGELFLREDWVMNRIASWNPRDDGQRS